MQVRVMQSQNHSVVSQCRAFIKSMLAITPPDLIGVDVVTTAPMAAELADITQNVAGDPAKAPVSLTVASGKSPMFELRGAHAYATLCHDRSMNWGALVMITLTVLIGTVALILCRSRQR